MARGVAGRAPQPADEEGDGGEHRGDAGVEAGNFKLVGARSRLYQHRILHPNANFAAFFEIYTITYNYPTEFSEFC